MKTERSQGEWKIFLDTHPAIIDREVFFSAGTQAVPPQTDQKRNFQPVFRTSLLCRLQREIVLQCNEQLQTRTSVFLLFLVPSKLRCMFRPLYSRKGCDGNGIGKYATNPFECASL